MKKIKFSRNQFNVDKLKKWARSIKKKDGYRCVACGYRKVLHSHHIMPKSKYPKNAYKIWNGVTLCKLCHLGPQGVHGQGKPRNQMVKRLRDLLKGDDADAVKIFDVKERGNRKKKKPYVNKVKRRRFYK